MKNKNKRDQEQNLVFINFDFRCISNTRFNFSLARVLIIGLINYTLV